MDESPSSPPPRSWLYWSGLIAVLVAGACLRLFPTGGEQAAGFDEVLYRAYVQTIDLGKNEELAPVYILRQERPGAKAELPPTRILYVICGWLWKRVQFGDAPPVDMHATNWLQTDPILLSLRRVTAAVSVLFILLAGAAGWRMLGPGAGLAATALFAFSPLAIHMSQHAFIDGFFAFWAMLALWSLWESLHHSESLPWLALYGFSLAAMVATKENALFVYVGLVAIIAVNRWARFGRVTPALLAVTVIGPAIGFAAILAAVGGPQNFIRIFQLFSAKARVLDFAIEFQDGPWYRYLVDLLVISPLVFCLALGALFRVRFRRDAQENQAPAAAAPGLSDAAATRTGLYLLVFVAVTFLIMGNLPYGLNLRFATIWDLPLRLFAYAQVCWLAARFPRRQLLLASLAIAFLCLYDARQYYLFFVRGKLYELASAHLMNAVQIVK